MSKIKRLALEINQNHIAKLARKFKKEGVNVLMPTYVPQRGEILKCLAQHGVDVTISGGLDGAKYFKGINQYGLEEDTLLYAGRFPEHITRKIVGVIPEEKLKDKKVAIFSYVNSLGWSNYIKERNLNTEIIATVEQNLRNYFEEKGNLIEILQKAGLLAYAIPTEHVNGNDSVSSLAQVYERLKNEDGRVVVQDCRSEFGNVGGKGTVFISSKEEFIKNIRENKTNRKVAKFINGAESNLSFFAGNTLVGEHTLGAKRMNLDDDMNPNDPKTLDKILLKAQSAGIGKDNTAILVGRGTLKAVGDPVLTSVESNGVGNDIGYIYDQNVAKQISEIGHKLAHLMAMSGKVGLAGTDLIVDKNGKVWVNEINDRQQGPTAQMSEDAERNGLPSLMKVSLLANFADMREEKTQKIFQSLRDNCVDIHNHYANSQGEFYMKLNATHACGTEKVINRLKPGYYNLVKHHDGTWRLDIASHCEANASIKYHTNPNEGMITIKLAGGDWKTGDEFPNGAQLFRLSGVTNKANPPFIVANGKTILNPAWKGAVEACYAHLFGADYMRKNPLLKQRILCNKKRTLQSMQNTPIVMIRNIKGKLTYNGY